MRWLFRFTYIEDAVRDLRYGLRGLARTPGFAAIAILTLALGIGANSAIFSVLYAVMLAPPPYPAGSRLVDLSMKQAGDPYDKGISHADLEDWRRQTRLFADFAAHYGRRDVSVTGAGEAEQLEIHAVSANLFRVLGVAPMAGRGFAPEEDGAGGPRSAILSYGYWQRRFGGNRSAIGRRIELDGEGYVIVGVMPRKFEFPFFWADYSPAVWISMNLSPAVTQQRDSRALDAVGLLKPGVTLAQAQSEMATIGARLAGAFPKENGGWSVKVSPLEENRGSASARPTLLLLMGAAAFVLLIACVNLANLLLARNTGRDRELAVRRALGASRLRLARQLLVETVLLAVAGGSAGALLAWVSLPAVKSVLPGNTPRVNEISLNWVVLAFTAGAALVTALLFGLMPAWRAAGSEAAATRRFSARQRPARILVTAEVALALMLVSAAGLLIESFRRVSRVEMGFDRENVLTMRLQLSRRKYPDAQRVLAFRGELERRVAAIRGVQRSGIVSILPLGVLMGSTDVEADGRTDSAEFTAVNAGYLPAIGTPLVYGRYFEPGDRAGSAPVTVVSESLARRFWRGADAVGRRIRFGDSSATIVGVVRDVRGSNPDKAGGACVYGLVSQLSEKRQAGVSGRFIVLVLRTAAEPAGMQKAVRAAVAAIDPDQPVTEVSTMQQLVERSLSGRRLNMILLSVFASLAMTLAAVGVFGVVSYAVARRTNEIGIRMALGARPETILAMVARDTLLLGAAGVGIGLVGTLAISRLLTRFLFGVAATEPAILGGVAVLLVAVVVLAALGPARRAMRVDPVVALRD